MDFLPGEYYLVQKVFELHIVGTCKIEYFNCLQLIVQNTFIPFDIPGLEIPACWGRLPFIGYELLSFLRTQFHLLLTKNCQILQVKSVGQLLDMKYCYLGFFHP